MKVEIYFFIFLFKSEAFYFPLVQFALLLETMLNIRFLFFVTITMACEKSIGNEYIVVKKKVQLAFLPLYVKNGNRV